MQFKMRGALMLRPGSYEHICRMPEAAYARLRPEIGARLGGTTSAMFPDFAAAFPLTVAAMEAGCSAPVACLEYSHRGNDWLASLVQERPDLNLFFDLRAGTLRSISVLPAACGWCL